MLSFVVLLIAKENYDWLMIFVYVEEWDGGGRDERTGGRRSRGNCPLEKPMFSLKTRFIVVHTYKILYYSAHHYTSQHIYTLPTLYSTALHNPTYYNYTFYYMYYCTSRKLVSHYTALYCIAQQYIKNLHTTLHDTRVAESYNEIMNNKLAAVETIYKNKTSR